MIKTPVCDMLGIKYPVFQGGMAWVSDSSLASAVSNAGGLGVIAAMNMDCLLYTSIQLKGYRFY